MPWPVVVSAMAGQTNQLVALVDQAWGFKAKKQNGSEASALYDGCEYDAVVSSGEQVNLRALCRPRSAIHGFAGSVLAGLAKSAPPTPMPLIATARISGIAAPGDQRG